METTAGRTLRRENRENHQLPVDGFTYNSMRETIAANNEGSMQIIAEGETEYFSVVSLLLLLVSLSSPGQAQRKKEATKMTT